MPDSASLQRSNGHRPPDEPASAPGGVDPELGAVLKRLETLRPGEPAGEARDRIWQVVAKGMDQAGPPSLAAAARLRQLQPAGPTNQQQRRIWRRVQAGLAGPRPAPARPRLAWGWAVAVTAAIVLASVVNSAAQAALPGSPLYAVKLSWEQVQWSLAIAPGGRAELAVSLANRRQAEAAALVARGAEPARVGAALRAALLYLEAAPPEEAARAVENWRTELAGWPPEYQGPAEAVLKAGAGGGPPLPPAATATPSATAILPTATATALPPSPMAGPSATQPQATGPVPSATAQPSTTAAPTASAIPLPTNGLAGSPTALPTGPTLATHLPLLTTTPILPLLTTTPILPLPTVALTPAGGPSATSIVPTFAPTGTPILPLPTIPATLPVTLPPTVTPAPSATPLFVLPTITVTLPVPLP
ncbi:MAG: DUF5667 domain-containing protein [Anaerolineales bacterium]